MSQEKIVNQEMIIGLHDNQLAAIELGGELLRGEASLGDINRDQKIFLLTILCAISYPNDPLELHPIMAARMLDAITSNQIVRHGGAEDDSGREEKPKRRLHGRNNK